MRRILTLITLSLAILVLTVGGHALRFPAISAPTDATLGTTFVHLFEWTWDDIAQECEASLGPQGFYAVQISPPNEHVVLRERHFPWWQRYQPVSYQLISRSGDRTQLARMIQRCHAAGVKIYADAVINHMAGVDRGIGSAGSTFTKYNYPGLYRPQDFNDCRRNIQSYQDRYDVTTCELVGLSDLRTESPYVRQRLVQYLQDLISLGVDGFRIDAAKHIPAADLGAILALLDHQVEPDPFIYQEVIDPGTEAIKKMEYYPNGTVLEFEYGRLVGEKMMGIQGQTLAQLETLGESWGLAPGNKAMVFIDNHDKQRGHGGGGHYLTYQDGKLYELANVFMLAHPYGYPQVMSSYAFTDPDQGPPADADGRTRQIHTGEAACGQAWVCEHRWQAIAQMVGFRKATAAVAGLTDWWSNGHNQIAFGRGDRGFVVINREETPLTHTFQTQLSPGTYCNVIAGDRTADGRGCTAPNTMDTPMDAPVDAPVDTPVDATVVVDETGKATITTPAMSATAIHIGAKLS